MNLGRTRVAWVVAVFSVTASTAACGSSAGLRPSTPNGVPPTLSKHSPPTARSSPSAVETHPNVETLFPQLSVEQYTDGASLLRAWYKADNNSINVTDVQAIEAQSQTNTDGIPGLNKIVDTVNAPLDQAYASTYLIDHWQENPDLIKFVNQSDKLHHVVAYAQWATSPGKDPTDLEEYKFANKLTSVNVVSQADGQMVVNYRYVAWDNADKNHADESVIGKSYKGDVGGATVTFVAVGGEWKISDMVYYAG